MLEGLSPRTKQNYIQNYFDFDQFVGTSPTEIITKRWYDQKSDNMDDMLFFEGIFRSYKETLEQNNNLKPISVRTKLTVVAAFFTRNGYPLNLRRGDWESTKQQPIVQRITVKTDDVKAMYAHAGVRDRALLLVLAQSGLARA